jgi:hypothetical protein
MKTSINPGQTISDHKIKLLISESIVRITRILNFSDLNKKSVQSLISTLDDLKELNNYANGSTMNYLKLKSTMEEIYKLDPELDAIKITFKLKENICHSRTGTATIKLQKNG